MEIIGMPRGHGKTTSLIVASSLTDYRIITKSNLSSNYVVSQAEKLGLKIPKPISFIEYHKTKGLKDDGLLLDDVEIMFEMFAQDYLNHIPIKAATITIP